MSKSPRYGYNEQESTRSSRNSPTPPSDGDLPPSYENAVGGATSTSSRLIPKIHVVAGKSKVFDKVFADSHSFKFWKHSKSEKLTWQEPTFSATKNEILHYVVEYFEKDTWKEVVRTLERWTELRCGDWTGLVKVGSETFHGDFTLRIGCRVRTASSLMTGMYSDHVTVSVGHLHSFQQHPEFF